MARRTLTRILVLLAAGLTLLGLAAHPAEATSRRRRVTNDYRVQILADEQTTQAGGGVVYPFQLVVTSGFRGAVFFDVQGLPDGVSYSVNPRGRNQFDLQLVTPRTLPSSSTVAVLNARSSGRVRQALLRLTVVGNQPPTTVAPPPPAVSVVPLTFELKARTPELAATNDQLTQFFIDVDRTLGYQGNVNFTVAGLPAEVKAGFAPNPTVAGTVLYITTTAQTPSGAYTLTIRGEAQGVIRTIAVRLLVNTTADFLLAATPVLLSVAPGGAVTYNIDVRPTVKAAVALEVAGLPANTTAQFRANPTTTATQLVIRTSSATPSGTYTLTITGKNGQFAKAVQVQLNIAGQPGFGLSANPTVVNVARNGTGSTFVAISILNGFNAPVAIAVPTVPNGTAATLSLESGGTRVTFFARGDAPVGQTKIKIIGTSGALSATIEIIVNVI